MNNQAAQTMPSWVQERELIRATLCKALDTEIESDERTYTIAVRAANALHWRQVEIDELKAQVAALSQHAGVPEGWTLDDLQDLYDRLVSAGISKFMEGSSNKAADRQFIHRAITEAWGLIGEMLAAAPAASGGGCNCASGRGSEHCVVHANTVWDQPQTAPEPLAQGDADV